MTPLLLAQLPEIPAESVSGTAWMTVGILLVGVVTVVGGVLFLRLHAFLALLLGALFVALLTPEASVERSFVQEKKVPLLATENGKWLFLKTHALPGELYLILGRNAKSGRLEPIADLRVERLEERKDGTGKTVMCAVAAVSPGKDFDESRFFTVIHPRDYSAAVNLSRRSVGARIAEGFGSTCAKIAILIAMAAIIGKCLLDSGAADRIVRSTLRLFGERGAPLSFLSSGFLLAIPVFFDTVFYLMIPLGKAMRLRTGKNYLLYVLAIVAGGSMAHSLVPPTPGPLFVAEQLGVDLGTMILAGCAVGFFTSGAGFAWALFANRKWDLPLRDSPEMTLSDLESLSRKDDADLPPLWLSLLPILLPVAFIGGFTILKRFSDSVPGSVMGVAATLGDKNIALVIAAAIAMATLVVQKRTSRKELANAIQASLASGGVIILITAGGGAFGGILRQTGVADLIQDLPQSSSWAILSLAFLITAAIRTAQGSSTVAMITAVGILSGVATSDTLGFHPVYLALAIGCGSKPIGWMNDSGFWVIGKLSGMTEGETLKTITPLSAIMGFVGLIVILIGVTIFPGA